MKEKTRQELIKTAGGDAVYVPKAVCLAHGMPWEPVTLKQAVAMGATDFHVKEPGNGIVANWPQFYFDLASAIEASFPAGQWLYQPRDIAALQVAVHLHRNGRGDEALAFAKAHMGVPPGEMPGSFLEQAGLA